MIALWWGLLTADAGTWEQVRAHRTTAPVAATAAARADYGALVRALVAAAPSGTLPPDLAVRADALGFGLHHQGDRAWLVDDRGAGLVGVRLGPLPAELVLQAPHPVADLDTGRIAAAMFDAGSVRAVCLATVHRRHTDAAHDREGALQAATDAIASALLDPLFVQIHGFGAATDPADAVWSPGATRAREDTLLREVGALEAALGVSDVRTGDEVPDLAGTTNVQGRLLADRARFRHLELSRPLRRALAADADRRQALSRALIGFAGPVEAR